MIKKLLLVILLLVVPAIASAQGISTTTCPGAGCIDFNVAGQGSLGIQITGTWVGTITFQSSVNGSTFATLLVTPSGSGTTVSTTTGNGVWQVAVAGFKTVRVVFTAYTSGTATVVFRSTQTSKSFGSGGGGVTGGTCTNQAVTAISILGVPTCTTLTSSYLTAPGSDTQVIFNDGNAFGGNAGLTFNKTMTRLSLTGLSTAGIITGDVPSTGFANSTAGLIIGVNEADTDSAKLFMVGSGSTGGPSFETYVSNGTVSSPANSVNGDALLSFETTPWHGGFFAPAGQAVFFVGGDWQAGPGAFPGRYELSVRTADGTDYAYWKFNPDASLTTPGDITLVSGGALKTDTTTAHTALFKAYDVDGTAYKTFATLTNGNTPDFTITPPSGGTVNLTGSLITAPQFITSGSAPAVSNTTANSCGTTAATIAGTDGTGVITVGATAGTSCTLTFVLAAPTRRQCWANNETTGNLTRYTYTDTTHGILAGTFVAGDKVSYGCMVY